MVLADSDLNCCKELCNLGVCNIRIFAVYTNNTKANFVVCTGEGKGSESLCRYLKFTFFNFPPNLFKFTSKFRQDEIIYNR